MTNELLLILLGIAVVLLGVASEVTTPANRLMTITAAVLGVVVIVTVLVR